MCGGGKTTSETNTNSSFTPPPAVLANYTAATQQAQNVAATPYSAYGGQLVSPINSQQNTGINAVNSASGIQNGYNAGATGLAGASAAAINPTAVNAAAIQQYESPYQSDVINATEAQIQNQNQQQAAALQGNSIASGSFGGDRAGVAQAQLAGQQDIASNATLANLENQNYSQALGEANTQQSVGLGAAQNTAARQLAASQQLGTLGNTAQTEALNEANAQTNAGTLEQTTQQAQDTAAYNQFLQQQAYPFETTGWLANIVEGIGSQSGGSSTGQTTTQSSGGSQIAGGLLGLASFLARGGRVPQRALGGLVGRPHYDTGGAIYIPPVFDPTAPVQAQGLGGGSIVPALQLPVGRTMPTNGAPAAPAAQPNQANQMAQMGKAVKGLGNSFENSSLGDQFNDAMQDANDPVDASAAAAAAPADSGVLDGGLDLGLGGIGAMARGGLVGRRHFDTGGGTGGGGHLPSGMGYDAPVQQKPVAATPVGSGKPANAPAYTVFPQQLSDGSWTTTQNIAQGLPPISGGSGLVAGGTSFQSAAPQGGLIGGGPLQANMFAKGGLVGRPHYDDGGVVPDQDVLIGPNGENPFTDSAPVVSQGTPAQPVIDLSPASLMKDANNSSGLAAAAALPVPAVAGGSPTNGFVPPINPPTPPVSPSSGLLANAGDIPAPAVAGGSGGFSAPSDAPLPPERPVAPIQTGGLAPSGGISPAGGPIAHAADGTPVATDRLGNAIDPGTGQPSSAVPSAPDQTFARMIGIESGGRQFNADGTPLTSPKGAVGVAQVEPGTGPEAAKLAGLPWDPARLASDPAYNMALGKAYYQSQLATYGSPDKAAAAYNAGPGAVNNAMAMASKNGGSYLDYLPQETQAYVANATGSGSTALAYDGGRSGINGAPAVAAIDANAAPAGGIAGNGTAGNGAGTPQVSMPQYPDSSVTPDSGKTGLLGLNLSPDTRQMMLSAGLGIMGATGRSFLGNIGTGAAQGIAAARQNANTASEIGLRTEQTQSAHIENQMKAAQLKLMMDSLNGNAPPASGGSSGGASAPSPTTPTVTAPGVSGSQPGASSSAAAGPQLDPHFDPAVIARQIDMEKWVNPHAAQADRERLNQIVQSGRARDVNGNIVNLPGFADAEAQVAGEKKFAEGNAQNATVAAVDPVTGAKYVGGVGAAPVPAGAAPNAAPPKPFSIDPETAAVSTSIPNAPKGGGYIVPNLPAGARMTELPESTKQQMNMDAEFQKDQVSTMRATPTVIARTQAIAQAFKTFQSGSLTDHQHDAAALAVALGQPAIAQKIMGGSISGPEWVDKEGVQSVLDTLKSATPRFAQSEFNAVASHGTPNTTNQPQANHEMVAEMLALGQRNNSFMKDWESAKQQGWASPSAFYESWDAANPLNGFIKSAQRQIGNFAGMDLPNANDWAAGSVYVAPSKLPPTTGALLSKYGVKPGTMFRFNGRNAAQPVAPISKSDYFSAQLGAQ